MVRVTDASKTLARESDPLGVSYREREESLTLSTIGKQIEHQRGEHQRGEHRSPGPGQSDTVLAPETELLTLNIGPHHPATHGVLRLLTTLEGEVVKDTKPLIGYVHTGIEKNCEDKSYWKVIPLIERMDYVSYYFNALAYCMAVEQLLDEQVPERAQYLRVIHLELCRIHSHLVWLGTSALDLGAISMFWYCFRERDNILDLFEMSSGQRMHTRYFQIGGVFEDIPNGFAEKLGGFVKQMPGRIDQFAALLDNNEIFLRRMKGIGTVSEQRLLELGVTGPLLRATGNPWDLRKAAPYSSYDKFDFKIPVGTVGDNYDRYRVRLAEMYESCKIIEQALDGLPGGPHSTQVPLALRPPAGEAYARVEGPRGELGYYLVSDEGPSPYRFHIRPPSFINLSALKEMTVGGTVADAIVVLGSIDIVVGEVDR